MKNPAAATTTLVHLLRRLAIASLPLALPLAAMAADAPMAGHDHMHASQENATSPLAAKVRGATKQYRDINVAMKEGWVQATPCVSSPNEGAMGVHFVKPERIHDGVLKADEPEMLIYEPLPGGKYRLVGVEYIVLAGEWTAKNQPGVAPSVDGHLTNFVGEPNRYALPAFHEMHVWAWQDNPNGTFADFNSQVSCAKQAIAN